MMSDAELYRLASWSTWVSIVTLVIAGIALAIFFAGPGEPFGQPEAEAVAPAGDHGKLPGQIGYGYVLHGDSLVSVVAETRVTRFARRMKELGVQGPAVPGYTDGAGLGWGRRHRGWGRAVGTVETVSSMH